MFLKYTDEGGMVRPFLVILLVTVAFHSKAGNASGMVCDGPEFTDENIIEIVKRERAVRKNLRAKFENPTVTVNRKRCHYVYIEYPHEKTVGKNHIFVINQFGAIVDVKSGRTSRALMKCPEVEYSLEDLTGLVKVQRSKYKDLPAEPDEYETKFIKMRCLYVYYETPLPKVNNKYQTLTLDYYGDVYETYESK